MEVLRAGRYKTAVEPLLRGDMSPELEANQALIDNLWAGYAETVVSNRQMDGKRFVACCANGLSGSLRPAATVRASPWKRGWWTSFCPGMRALTGCKAVSARIPRSLAFQAIGR